MDFNYGFEVSQWSQSINTAHSIREVFPAPTLGISMSAAPVIMFASNHQYVYAVCVCVNAHARACVHTQVIECTCNISAGRNRSSLELPGKLA